jgi:hypothetical protein
VTGRKRIAPERPACAGHDGRSYKLLARPLAGEDGRSFKLLARPLAGEDGQSFKLLARPRRAATPPRSQA